jgi:NAD(P)-dependent dehydrogenase (short-subunit alcohol dehydrogenase family)
MTQWTANDIPDQTGRVVVVTGANSGLGYESALALARKGAHVIMACRSAQRAADARQAIEDACTPGASIDVMPLDLGSLASVRAFAADFSARFDRLDLLLNNAGLMATPQGMTADGFETQFGVNHLGHFALTGLLLPLLLRTPGSRVVTTSSIAHRTGKMNFDDLNLSANYSRYGAYGQSKLANVLFAFELQRRLSAAGAGTISLAAHPGFAETNLQRATAAASGSRAEGGLYETMLGLFAQSQEMGALPQLYAATAPAVKGGEFYGPSTLDMRGYPKRVNGAKATRDTAAAARLWAESERLTGVVYDFAVPQAA